MMKSLWQLNILNNHRLLLDFWSFSIRINLECVIKPMTNFIHWFNLSSKYALMIFYHLKMNKIFTSHADILQQCLNAELN